MASRRRVSPELMRAFESAQVEPFDFETPGRIVEVPVPAEQFHPNDSPETAPSVRPELPKSRFDVVREYLESTRQNVPQPTTPEVDVRGAADFDNRRNFGQSMLAAGQAFTGNRRAMPQVTNAAETQAQGEREARKRELEQWAAGRETQRTREAGLLGQALTADEAARQREASFGLQKDRLGLDKEKQSTAAEDKDIDRDAKAAADVARIAAKKGTGAGAAAKAAERARRNAEGLPYGYELMEGSNSSKKQREDAATAVEQRDAILPTVDRLQALTSAGPERLASPAARAEVAQAAEQIGAAIRVIENLGVPSGPDVQIQLRLIGDPNNPINEVAGVLPKLLSNLRDYFNNKTETRLKTFGIRKSVGVGVQDPNKNPKTVTVREKKTGRTKALPEAAARALPPAEFEVLP